MLKRLGKRAVDGYQPKQILRVWADLNQSMAGPACPHSCPFTQETPMKLLTDLFTTDYGIMSISGIAFMLCMAAFFIWYFNHKMNEPAPKNSP
jgi:hypothetical protein